MNWRGLSTRCKTENPLSHFDAFEVIGVEWVVHELDLKESEEEVKMSPWLLEGANKDEAIKYRRAKIQA